MSSKEAGEAGEEGEIDEEMPTRMPPLGRSSSITYPPPSDLQLMFPPPFLSTPSGSLKTLTETAASTIFRINDALTNNSSRIRWEPSDFDIQEKLRKNSSYFLRTAHNMELIFDTKINEVKSVVRKRGPTLIVDLTNIYYAVKTKHPSFSKEERMYYIYYLICKVARAEGIINIIICQQNHFLNIESYNAIKDFLHNCTDILKYNITYLTGHNRSSEDDLYVILCIEAFIRNSREDFFVLSEDGYRDFVYNNPEGGDITIYELLAPRARININTYMNANNIDDYMRRFYPRRRRSRGGGTKKNKKSLLNKYTRKTIHYIKPKKSHKKRTIHKKRTTYKKHRTYKKRTK